MEPWVVGTAAAAAGLTAFLLRPRLPAAVTVLLLAATSAVLGWGVIRLRPDPSTAEVVLAVAAMALLGPAHARAVLGPLGRR